MSKKLKKNVPELRFPEFEGKWKEKCLREISINGFSNGVFNDPQKVGTGYRLINVKDMYSGESIDIDSLTRLQLDEKEFLNNQAKYGDIFFTRSSLVKEGIAHSNVLLSEARDITYDGHLIKFSLNQDNYFPQFIALALKTDLLRSQLVARGKTGTMTTIGQDDVATVKLFFPPIAEQEKIASFLGAVDTRLNQLRRKRELLQTYKRGIMRKLFSQELRFKNAIGSEFPDWEKEKLGDIFKRVTQKNTENNTNVLTISAQYGLINQKEFFNKSVAADNVTGYYLLKQGDFAYNKSYSNGYPMGAIKRLNRYEKGVVSTLYICFTNPNEIESQFYEQYFDGGYLNSELHKVAQEGARNHGLLNMSVVEFFKDITIDYPDRQEQEKIVNFLAVINRNIEAISRQIEKTEQFKKGLLQKMFV